MMLMKDALISIISAVHSWKILIRQTSLLVMVEANLCGVQCGWHMQAEDPTDVAHITHR
jgi:hypothetical protein